MKSKRFRAGISRIKIIENNCSEDDSTGDEVNKREIFELADNKVVGIYCQKKSFSL